jgi:hypothetical protein
MDDRDWKLLRRQMRNFQQAPRRDGVMILILAGIFLAGLTAGNLLSASHPSLQGATNDGKPVLAFFFNGTRNSTE